MLDWIKSFTRAGRPIASLVLVCTLVVASVVTEIGLIFSADASPDDSVSFLGILSHLDVTVVVGSPSNWVGIILKNCCPNDVTDIIYGMIFGVPNAAFFHVSIVVFCWSIGHSFVVGTTYFGLLVATSGMLLRAMRLGVQSKCSTSHQSASNSSTQFSWALQPHRGLQQVSAEEIKRQQGLRRNPSLGSSMVPAAKVGEGNKTDRIASSLSMLRYPAASRELSSLEPAELEAQRLLQPLQYFPKKRLGNKLPSVSRQRYLNRSEVGVASEVGKDLYACKSILVSGAGGSIGSELCRQLIRFGPKKLIIYEISELALYNIHTELVQVLKDTDIEIVPVLGSVCNSAQVKRIVRAHDVSVVFHAAAYKHVSLVEANPLAGIANNVFGVQTLAQISVECGVEKFLLVSSDKAVRPTNVMGASKRLAEQVVLDLASRQPKFDGTIFSIVRFGNVLGTSGSVVPRFQQQLKRGGPLTVTHSAVTRYFMTIDEAVSLLMRAASMAEGSEVFIFDMGEPVKIIELARKVIETSGYTVRDERNPGGEIKIEITGLGPGEKMFEELTLSGNLGRTPHAKILVTRENALSRFEVATLLRDLKDACERDDEFAALGLLERWVEGFPNVTDRMSSLSGQLAHFS